MRIEKVETREMEVCEAITRPLAEASTFRGFAYAPKYVTLALTESGIVDGGLIGEVYWNWMRIDILAVPEEKRGQGLGRALMARAECEARALGCVGVWVDTYSFQSPGFYEKLGFRPFGHLPDYPRGETRIFLAKRLDGVAEADLTEAA